MGESGNGSLRFSQRLWPTVVIATPRVQASSKETLSGILSWMPPFASIYSRNAPSSWLLGLPGD